MSDSLPSASQRSSNHRTEKSTGQFMSLADLLQSNSKSGVKTRSGDSNKLFQLDLQKRIDASNSRLNMTRAYNLGSTDSFNFVDVNVERNDEMETDKAKLDSTQLNNHLLNDKQSRALRKNEGKFSKKDEKPANALNNYSTFNGDPLKQIQTITSKIDNKDARFDFDDKDKNVYGKVKTPGFNMIQLPKDFNVDRGRVNVYRSGIVEVVSHDNPPKIMRFKPTIHGINNVFTDLVITTNNQVYLDQSNVFSPELLE